MKQWRAEILTPASTSNTSETVRYGNSSCRQHGAKRSDGPGVHGQAAGVLCGWEGVVVFSERSEAMDGVAVVFVGVDRRRQKHMVMSPSAPLR